MKLHQPTALIIFFALFFTVPASSQTTTSGNKDSIEMVKSFWGIKYYQGTQRLYTSGVNTVLKSNNEAFTYWKKGYGSYVFAQIIGAIGGALVGYEIGKSLGGGGKMNGAVLGIGGGLIVTSIIFGISGEKKMKKGIRIYNAALY